MLKYILLFTIALSSHTVLSQIIDRAEAVQEFHTNYIQSNIDSDLLQWTGDVTTCNPGTISTIAKDKLLQRINYFRRMVGVEDQITFSPALDIKCQQAVLMMNANDTLTHDPPDNLQCYTMVGDTAAQKSNLWGGHNNSSPYIDRDSLNPINVYIQDRGSSNKKVGHRRWLLNSKAKTFGVGQTNDFNALWVIQSTNNPSVYNDYIAYPPNGYIPNELVYDRWSFGIPAADFSNADVIVKDINNNNIPLTIVSDDATTSADNSIVWEPSPIITNSSEDVHYSVTINNVVLANGTIETFTYTTKIFEPLIMGDVNVDGQLNILDAVKVAHYVVGVASSGDCYDLDIGTELCISLADTNSDGIINTLDAVAIAQCISMLPNVLCPN